MKLCPLCAEEIKDEAIKCKHCGEYLESETDSNIELQDDVNKDSSVVQAESIKPEGEKTKENLAKILLKRSGIVFSGGSGVLFLGLGAIGFMYLLQSMDYVADQANQIVNYHELGSFKFLVADEIQTYGKLHFSVMLHMLYCLATTFISVLAVLYISFFPNSDLKKKKIAGWVLVAVAAINYMIYSEENAFFFIVLPFLVAAAGTLIGIYRIEHPKPVSVRTN